MYSDKIYYDNLDSDTLDSDTLDSDTLESGPDTLTSNTLDFFNRNYLTVWLKWRKFPHLITSSDGVKGIDKLLNLTAATAKAAG